jgi:hypothetical protein
MSEAVKASLRQRAAKEARDFLVVFAYVWFLLAIMSLHKSIVLSDAHIVQHQSFTFLKALAFAKILFVAERWRFGEMFGDRPLIWPVLFKSSSFAVLLLFMDIAEKATIDRLWPSMAARPGDDFAPISVQMVVSAGVVTFAALIPFFGLRELGKAVGERPLRELFFQRRLKFVPAPDETGQEPREMPLESAEHASVTQSPDQFSRSSPAKADSASSDRAKIPD